MDLNSARIFAQVVQKGSFSAAARSSGVPVATVSRRVAELEASLKVSLLERSTRKLRLTEAGATLYDYIARGVEEMDAGLLALREQENDLRGRLRFSMPPAFDPMWSLLDEFQSLYKNVEIDLFVSERRWDFSEDGVDIALRVGSIESQSAIARPLTVYRHKLVASPAFLEENPIETPLDIAGVSSAAWGAKGSSVEWLLGEHKVVIQPFLQTNDYLHLKHLAIQHRCITELPPFFCDSYFASGELVEVLPKFPLPEQQVNLVHPSRKSVSRIARVFIDFCLENFPL